MFLRVKHQSNLVRVRIIAYPLHPLGIDRNCPACLMRAFNIRHGVNLAVEAPSILYSSVPVDGPAKGRDVKPHWNHMLDEYYKHMGWDRKSGRPLMETLKKLGLEAEARDLWG